MQGFVVVEEPDGLEFLALLEDVEDHASVAATTKNDDIHHDTFSQRDNPSEYFPRKAIGAYGQTAELRRGRGKKSCAAGLARTCLRGFLLYQDWRGGQRH
ncbi:MAG: hypothetical protein AMXMBFR20_18300 [Planctomycetia bacterium]